MFCQSNDIKMLALNVVQFNTNPFSHKAYDQSPLFLEKKKKQKKKKHAIAVNYMYSVKPPHHDDSNLQVPLNNSTICHMRLA